MAGKPIENRSLAPRARVALVSARTGEDAELCVADFAVFGLIGTEVLDELLALHGDTPIVLSAREPASAAAGPVRRIVRRPRNLLEFHRTVRRLRRTGGPMYLKLES